MQQIFRQSDEHFEVYTTVFSPQVCRSRTRTGTRHVEAEKVVAALQHRSGWQKELFKEDEVWWFGRLSAGKEGYFPAACVEPLQGGDSSGTPPTLVRRGSVPVAMTTETAPCGCTSSGWSTPKLLWKSSIRRPLGRDGCLAAAPPNGCLAAAPPNSCLAADPLHASPSLLHRVLAKSRRKSCPHLPHSAPETGSINTAFQPD